MKVHSLTLILAISLINYSNSLAQSDSNKAICNDAVLVADEFPTFQICLDSSLNHPRNVECSDWVMQRKIDESFNYPEDAAINQIEGEVETTFLINHEGYVERITFNNSIGYGCEEEVIRLLNSLPKFIPAKKDSLNVCIFKTITIKFKIGLKPYEEIYQVVETMPSFPGCDQKLDKTSYIECSNIKMLEFIYNHNLKYPEEAKLNNVHGTVIIRFVVNEVGDILDPIIIKDIGYGLGEEALRVVNTFPNFNPGFHNGKPVKVYYQIPIKFSKWN